MVKEGFWLGVGWEMMVTYGNPVSRQLTHPCPSWNLTAGKCKAGRFAR